ncbi:dockerin type I domain-containing protein [Gloeobacter violaceus]|uniref:dockerin type I domain-containing protein n=1 Tax=Gloeobacter violaceus TaxID=33072 RepID=UPI001E37E201|nr:dockerin type I domain-containing protein [Gloeobacter violaceus]
MRHRSQVLFITAASLLLLAQSLPAASGDVNSDGRVDDLDIRIVEQYLRGDLLLQNDQIKAADADGDGKVTRNDRDLLKRRLEGITVKSGPASQLELQSVSGGVVLDKATGKPLAGVEVSLPDEGITVRTDAQGRFKLARAPAGKILTAKASSYAPQSITLARGGSGGYRLLLEQLNPQLMVVDDNLYHLGNDDFDPNSAGALQFNLRSIGGRFEKTFELTSFPREDLTLRIGSLIGLDTPESVAAGQSGLTDRILPRGGLRIFLNGSAIERLVLNGDDLEVKLPRWLLQRGTNRLMLSVDPYDQNNISISKPVTGLYGTATRSSFDLDDIEFAHLVIVDPTGSLVDGKLEGELGKKPSPPGP